MPRKTLQCAVLLIAGLECVSPLPGCTAFGLENHSTHILGANFDNQIHEGLLFVNKRGVSKRGWSELPDSETHAAWTSKYGSISFNLVMSQSVWGGMNEAGLMFSTLYLSGSRPTPADERPWLYSNEWLQYILDTCASVGEVIESFSEVRVEEGYADHYLVCDRDGACASIEFIDGEVVIHTGETMPVNVLANSSYAESVASWRTGEEISWDESKYMPSLLRFRTAAERSQSFGPFDTQTAVDYAFATLTAVSGGITQWSIVFDSGNQRLYFRTRVNPDVRSIDLSGIEFSCETPIKMIDIDANLSGDITGSLEPYSTEDHLSHAVHAMARWGGNVSRESMARQIQHIEGFECQSDGR